MRAIRVRQLRYIARNPPDGWASRRFHRLLKRLYRPGCNIKGLAREASFEAALRRNVSVGPRRLRTSKRQRRASKLLSKMNRAVSKSE